MPQDISNKTLQNNRNAVTRKLQKPKQWEFNLVGNFMLSLYHGLVISPQNEWTCKKQDIQKAFEQFVLRTRPKYESGDEVGSLLHRCGFLVDKPKNSDIYTFNSISILKFHNNKLNEKDQERIGSEENYEIDEDSPEHNLQWNDTKCYLTNNYICCDCDMDFSNDEDYEEHIRGHIDRSEWSYLRGATAIGISNFSVSYRFCKKSDYLRFTIQNETSRIFVIEKIIIMEFDSFFYVHNKPVPFDIAANDCAHVFVNWKSLDLPDITYIRCIFHEKKVKGTRITEDYIFPLPAGGSQKNSPIGPNRLASKQNFKTIEQVKDYFPPLAMHGILNDDSLYKSLQKTPIDFQHYTQNGKILQPHSIASTLTTLLHMEDMDIINDYLKLFQCNVQLSGSKDNYSMMLNPKERIDIENILSNSDEVIITRKGITTEMERLALIFRNNEELMESNSYVGQIDDIYLGKIQFKCRTKIDLERRYMILFRPSRLQIRYQYRAMELLPRKMTFLKKFLFPEHLLPKSPSTLSLSLYNEAIYHNPEQLQAVRNIAHGPRNDATYIIFGPPGTGKTATVVESILQVLKRHDTKVVIAATSNAACDEVALRLCKVLQGSSDIFSNIDIARIYSKSSEARADTIDDVLLENSNIYSGHFFPDVAVLHRYRIVVCTSAILAKLSTGNFGQSGMYTHLFIDEVAASTEVDALMAMTAILGPNSCLVISGDNKQLGPIVKSKRAQEFNLAVSLMDRLLERECYRVDDYTGHYDRTIQSRLRQNFRSHPEIVKLYSSMYYSNDLEAKANIDDVSLVKHWHLAPSKSYPIIFHSINGKSCSDKHSFSLYNLDEVDLVMDYVKDLMYFGINGKPMKECNIGVISPYKKQFQRIRDELNRRMWYNIETGSVETFQGQEKDIIIVSFVRSGTSTLGFLESSRRLNVTLSRAKSLLILIGNAKTLSMSTEYDHIIKECQRHQTLISTNKEKKKWTRGDNKAGTLDVVTDNLKDLTLKNKSGRNNRRRSRGGKQNKRVSDNGKDNWRYDSDNDDDKYVVDNKPSTSNAGQRNISRSMQRENHSGNIVMANGRITANCINSNPTISNLSSGQVTGTSTGIVTNSHRTAIPATGTISKIKPTSATSSNLTQNLTATRNSKPPPSTHTSTHTSPLFKASITNSIDAFNSWNPPSTRSSTRISPQFESSLYNRVDSYYGCNTNFSSFSPSMAYSSTPKQEKKSSRCVIA